jgi:hypothetical protein
MGVAEDGLDAAHACIGFISKTRQGKQALKSGQQECGAHTIHRFVLADGSLSIWQALSSTGNHTKNVFEALRCVLDRCHQRKNEARPPDR